MLQYPMSVPKYETRPGGRLIVDSQTYARTITTIPQANATKYHTTRRVESKRSEDMKNIISDRSGLYLSAIRQ